VEAAFFERISTGTYRATSATAGPWSAKAQHGGPPSALAARDMELHEPDERMRLARVAIDILRPVPVDTITVRTRTLRPGRRVALLETVMEADGQEVLTARGWRIGRTADLPVIQRRSSIPELPESVPMPEFPGGHMDGYLAAIDWRFVSGGFDQPGPSQAWGRPRIPLVIGEEMTAMTRTLLLADSGSGIGMAIDPRKFLFLNVDLTVVLQRDPAAEWLLLDAMTTMGGQGTGMTQTLLSDRDGAVGTGLQTQLVTPA
jgi:acyl-Coa thioesterase superfamily protein/acyl-CoA thioesterase superfamily protein